MGSGAGVGGDWYGAFDVSLRGGAEVGVDWYGALEVVLEGGRRAVE